MTHNSTDISSVSDDTTVELHLYRHAAVGDPVNRIQASAGETVSLDTDQAIPGRYVLMLADGESTPVTVQLGTDQDRLSVPLGSDTQTLHPGESLSFSTGYPAELTLWGGEGDQTGNGACLV